MPFYSQLYPLVSEEKIFKGLICIITEKKKKKKKKQQQQQKKKKQQPYPPWGPPFLRSKFILAILVEGQ